MGPKLLSIASLTLKNWSKRNRPPPILEEGGLFSVLFDGRNVAHDTEVKSAQGATNRMRQESTKWAFFVKNIVVYWMKSTKLRKGRAIMKRYEEKSEPLTYEELLEACDILRSVQAESERLASVAPNGVSEAQQKEKSAFYRKQVLDIEHLIGTVQKMAEDALDGKEGAGREEIAAEVEIKTFVQGIADGMILGVDWEGIQEMLGEDKQRLHLCTLHPNIPSFPSPTEREHSFTEGEIMEILRRVNPCWMKEIYKNGNLFESIIARYFAVDEPKSEGWLGVPGVKDA